MNHSDFINTRCGFCGAGFLGVSKSGKTTDFHCGTRKIGDNDVRSIECYESQIKKLVDAHQTISSLHGNMSLDSIGNVNGINDGRDRAIKLRAAMEMSRAAITKYGKT